MTGPGEGVASEAAARFLERQEVADYEARLTDFAGKHEIPDEVASALGASALPLLFTGLPRDDIRNGLRGITLRHATLDQAERQAQVILDLFADDIESWTRASVEWDHYGASSRSPIPSLRRAQHYGLVRAPMLWLTGAYLQFLYANESPAVDDPKHLQMTEVPNEDLADLFGVDGAPPDLDFFTLAQAVRKAYGADLSRQTLDARLETFVNIARFDFNRLLVADVLAVFGLHHTLLARQLYREYGAGIMARPIAYSQQVMRNIADLYLDTARSMRSGPAREGMSILHRRMHRTATDVDEYLQFFTNVYVTLGYDLPPVLLEVDPPEVPKLVPDRTPAAPRRATVMPRQRAQRAVAAPKPTPLPPPAEPAPPPPDPTLVQEAVWRAQTWQDNADALLNHWRVTPKVIRQAGLDQLRRHLATGFDNAVHVQIIPPTPDANDLIGVIRTLNRLAERHEPEEVVTQTLDTIALCDALRAGSSILRQWAQSHNLPRPALPELTNIRFQMSRLAGNWPHFRQLILHAWPAREAPAVARRLEQIVAGWNARQTPL
jgi:hypothetical protein